MAETTIQPAEARTEPTAPQSRAEVDALIRRARDGDRSTLPQLRALLADPVRGRWYVDHHGSPPEWLYCAAESNIAGDDLVIREAFRRKLDEVRDELAGPDPTPMERLLADRAAWCWAEVNIRQSAYENSDNLSIRQAEFHQRRIDAAHRRFLSAIKTLATVRKLALPALRINVAQNQVNLG